MNYQKIASKFELASKVSAVITAPAIVLSTAATVTLFPLTILLSLAAGNLREKFNLIIRNPVIPVFLFFYSMFFIGILYTTAPWSDILLTLRKYDKFLFAIMFFPIFTEEKWRNYAISSFMIGILILSIASYLRLYGWLNFEATGPVEVFKPTIEFNFLMAFASYLCLYKITSIRGYRLIWTIFLGLIVCIVLFQSRGRSGYFVFALLTILFFIQKFSYRGVIIAITSLALLFGLAFVFSPTSKSRINEISNDIRIYQQNANTSVGLRVTFLKNSIKLIKQHPILGTGTGSFAREYATLKPTTLTRNPHNEYINIMVQFGIIGLGILLLFFGIPLWYTKFLPENLKYIARGTILGIMLGSLANSWLLDITTGYFYAYFIALTFAALSARHIDKPAG